MSLRSFTVLAHSLRKKDDLDLCHTRIHSLPRSCRFAFPRSRPEVRPHCAAPRATMRRSAKCGSPTPNWSMPRGRHERPDDPGMQMENQAHPCPDAFSRCFRKAPSLLDFPMSHSVTRSVHIPRPAAAARLCFALRAPSRVSAFRKSFRQNSAQNADEKIF